jgi:hypothetical protein
MRRRNLADRNANRRSLDFLDGGGASSSSEKLQQRRAVERREQYKQVSIIDYYRCREGSFSGVRELRDNFKPRFASQQ